MGLEEKLKQLTTELSGRQLGQESQETSKDSKFCPICGGMGFILFEKDGLCYSRKCDCYKERVLHNRLRFANLPEGFKDYTLQNFNAGMYRKSESRKKIGIACQVIKTYLAEFEAMEEAGLGLYIYSETKGSGKTRMAASLANELIKVRGKQVKFATSPAILKEIRATWDKDSQYTENRLIDELVQTEILIIDDFGTEKIADWINDKFYYLLNERYINRRLTIFTSNQSLKNLSYDERIVNRLKERSYEVAFPEESVRETISEINNANMLNKIAGGAKQ